MSTVTSRENTSSIALRGHAAISLVGYMSNAVKIGMRSLGVFDFPTDLKIRRNFPLLGTVSLAANSLCFVPYPAQTSSSTSLYLCVASLADLRWAENHATLWLMIQDTLTCPTSLTSLLNSRGRNRLLHAEELIADR